MNNLPAGRLFFLLCGLAVGTLSTGQAWSDEPIGVFDGHGDIGDVELSGGVTHDPSSGQYSVTGSGDNMWFDRDQFHFVWKRLRGDFIVQARVRFVGAGRHEHRKLGWMARTGLETDSACVHASIHGDGLASLQYRRATGGNTEEVKADITAPDVVQLQRQGNLFHMRVARFGQPFCTVSVENMELGDVVYVGLYVCSHDNEIREQAVLSDVRLVTPAKEDFVPYRDYIGGHLETVDVVTGERRIVMSSPDAIQAPNWTLDGAALIYNSSGRLFRFDLETRQSSLLDTGAALKNNNDHVISFDGTMLGISHHSGDDDGKSIIYTLPVIGGVPTRVTPHGPSYLHGWSPDDRYLIYTGERSGEFDIYRIPVEGGEEIRLTTSPGLDDGAEYAPDGSAIYFCSTRSGSMQIWKMKPDGSDQQQVTDDEFNNWFPHLSPDGKSIAFLSFTADVKPSDHPFYVQVYVRIVPVSGGEPKVIAYVYGGQGTINVPSWSPDSKRVAFVSNSDAMAVE